MKRREFASDDTDSAADLVRAKLRTLSPTLDRDTATRRLVGLLARRGFNAGIAYRVVSAELEAAAALRTAESADHDQPPSVRTNSSLTRRSSSTPSHDTGPVGSPEGSGDSPDGRDTGVADIADDHSEDDEQSRATELVRAKLRTLPQNLDHAKAMNRLVGLLARRGFSPSIAYSVVQTELADRR
ncbi:hypothetical protein ACFXHA_12095 [Nocardia sp. NPDC059240]|uniref:hypothetical protein n=1 Tax=Nocardia sp. NPDC059240 TaxID=3346786 RepID=UPI0036A2EE6D